MRAMIYFSLIVILLQSFVNCGAFKKSEKNNKDHCTVTLDSIISSEWVIYNTLTYGFEPSYVRNDRFANLLLNEYNYCLLGISKDEVIKKFGKPTNNDKISLIYSCYSKDSREIYCLRFWLNEEVLIQRVTYDQCMSGID